MRFELPKFHAKLRTLLMGEEGQDLVEYALVFALIAFGATAGMNALAGDINSEFSHVGSVLSTYVT